MELNCFRCEKEVVLAFRQVVLCSECATEICGTQPTDVQQLKAEIAALIPAVEACSGYARNGESVRSVVAKMRQLSAV